MLIKPEYNFAEPEWYWCAIQSHIKEVKQNQYQLLIFLKILSQLTCMVCSEPVYIYVYIYIYTINKILLQISLSINDYVFTYKDSETHNESEIYIPINSFNVVFISWSLSLYNTQNNLNLHV